MAQILNERPLVSNLRVVISHRRIPVGYKVIKLGNDKVQAEAPAKFRPRQYDYSKASALMLDPAYQRPDGKPYWKLIAVETGIPYQTLYSHFVTSAYRYGR